MKVVLFCGGAGMRIREYSDQIPKPMVPIGYRPMLWHVMKSYAQYGFKDFILCLGYKSNVIKEYFMNYDERVSNDFVMEGGREQCTLRNSDIDDWRITFVDTGFTSNIAERLVAVKPYLAGEETFLANYSDDLTDCPIPDLIAEHKSKNAVATFLAIKPFQSFHIIHAEADGRVVDIQNTKSADLWINGGFFVFSQRIFDYIADGDELVVETFRKLMADSKLYAHRYEGFWGSMDTFKEKQILDDLFTNGQTPWLRRP